MKIETVRSVEIIEKRWDVTVLVTLADGTVREFVASADSAFTDYSGIWFGTRAEYEQARGPAGCKCQGLSHLRECPEWVLPL